MNMYDKPPRDLARTGDPRISDIRIPLRGLLTIESLIHEEEIIEGWMGEINGVQYVKNIVQLLLAGRSDWD